MGGMEELKVSGDADAEMTASAVEGYIQDHPLDTLSDGERDELISLLELQMSPEAKAEAERILAIVKQKAPELAWRLGLTEHEAADIIIDDGC